MTNLLKKVIDWFDTTPKKYNRKCIDCNQVFDGNAPELFIKHQIDEKHYNYLQIPKTECFISFEVRADILEKLKETQKIMLRDNVDEQSASIVSIINDTLASALHLVEHNTLETTNPKMICSRCKKPLGSNDALIIDPKSEFGDYIHALCEGKD